jgi:Ice-binding-like
VTNFPPGIIVNGTKHDADALAAQAQADLVTAYDNAASSPCASGSSFDKTGINLGTQTLTPGTYCQTTAPTLTGTLTLSGNGVFIFQIGSTLVTAPGATVSLINGAQPCNVFWLVKSSATLDTTTTFVGTIMALTNIELHDGASIAGRALARNAAVTLSNNQITAPTSCNAVATTPPVRRAPRVPRAGAGPSQGDGFPWILAMIAGVLASGGAVGLGMSVRTRRRSR